MHLQIWTKFINSDLIFIIANTFQQFWINFQCLFDFSASSNENLISYLRRQRCAYKLKLIFTNFNLIFIIVSTFQQFWTNFQFLIYFSTSSNENLILYLGRECCVYKLKIIIKNSNLIFKTENIFQQLWINFQFLIDFSSISNENFVSYQEGDVVFINWR